MQTGNVRRAATFDPLGEQSRGSARRRRSGFRRYLRYRKLIGGATIVLLMVLMAIFAPLIAPHDPNSIDLMARLTPPAWSPDGRSDYLLGTDQLGRDILSRVITGARISLLVGLFSVLASGVLGVTLGLLAGYYGGRADSVIMRITDVQMALPFILVALLIVAILGPSLRNIVIVFTITAWYVYTRITRASTLSIREAGYVEAARVIGATDLRVLRRHILPSLMSPVMVIASFEAARIITTEAALGFLGLGVPPPSPTWGSMINDGRQYVQDAWWISTFAGLALVITVLAINLLGDALRDILDPRRRG